VTDIIRSDTPRRSLGAILVMMGLAIGAIFFTVLALLGVLLNLYSPTHIEMFGTTIEIKPQAIISFWFGAAFLLLTVFFDVYRREFVPDELIHKKRRPKIVPKRDIR